MVPYKVPDDLAQLNVTVMLFQVAFEQTPADALYHIALAKIASGMIVEAEQDIDRLIKESPDSFQPWLRKGELLYAREDWAGSANATLTGIKKAPEGERLGLFASAASSFFRNGRYAEAILIYREALQATSNSQIAAYLAFILATAKDDRFRNGRDAQVLAEAALKAEPNSPTVLNSLAVALAENGNFEEAIVVGTRALANAKLTGDNTAAQTTEQRLAAFRARKPWRQ
jgi:tetratricopeptide (TPR) repeat protein